MANKSVPVWLSVLVLIQTCFVSNVDPAVARADLRSTSETSPHQQNVLGRESEKSKSIGTQPTEIDCNVKLALMEADTGGSGARVALSVPPGCSCSFLVLQILQRHGVPCKSPSRPCAWRFAHTARDSGNATFLVPVAGTYRAIGNCPHYSRSQQLKLPGLQLYSWQVDVSVLRPSLDHIRVRVNGQVDRETEEKLSVFFPRLAVGIVERVSRRLVVYRRVDVAGDSSAELDMTELPLDCEVPYDLELTPGDSWVCQGANTGCPRRFLPVPGFRCADFGDGELVDIRGVAP